MKKVLSIIVSLMLIVSPVYALDSEGVIYDNSTSGSSATNVNDALNDLYSKLNEKQTEINNIKNIGNATSDKILSGYTAYVKGNTITGSIPSKGATTYTPGTVNQTIASGQYLSGAQTIKGDANLVAGNIAKGKSIFGVSGSYTSDANATASDMALGKTSYVNGNKITGTLKNLTTSTSIQHATNNGTRVVAGDAGYVSTNTDGVSRFQIRYNGESGIILGNTLFGLEMSKVANTLGINASKVAKGQTIAGVAGSYTSDANATAGNILSGKTAYVNGSKITGSMVDRTSNTGTTGLAWATNNLEITQYNQLRIGINPGYYGSANYSNWGVSGIVIGDFQTKLGITADKIVSGQTVAGVTGTGGGYKAYKFEKVKASVLSDKTFDGSWKNMMSKDDWSSFSIDLGFTPSEVVDCKAKLVGNYSTNSETSWGANFRISRGYVEMTHTGQNYYMSDLPSDMYLSNSNSTENYSDIITKCSVTGSKLVFTVSDSSYGTTTYVPVQTRATEFYLTGTLIYK